MDIISSRKNIGVRYLKELMSDKKFRDKEGCFVVEGDHLCSEAVRSGLECVMFAYTKSTEAKYPKTVSALRECSKSFGITGEISEYISDTKAPQGIYAAVRKRAEGIPHGASRVIVLDGVQDPGNVGTVIRTAEAFGFDGAVLLDGCADLYSPKTFRASMGSAFRLPYCCCSAEKLRSVLGGFTVYAAMLDNSAMALGAVKFVERTAVVIGSEGRGVSPGVTAVCDEKLYIPIHGAESLNAAVAAAVIMWEIKQGR